VKKYCLVIGVFISLFIATFVFTGGDALAACTIKYSNGVCKNWSAKDINANCKLSRDNSKNHAIPRASDPDANAFNAKFGLNDDELTKLRELVNDGSKTKKQNSTLGAIKKKYPSAENTGYLVSEQLKFEWCPNTIINLHTSTNQDASAVLNTWTMEINGKTEVLYAQVNECQNPVFVNKEILNDDGTGGGEELEAEITSYVKSSTSQTTFVESTVDDPVSVKQGEKVDFRHVGKNPGTIETDRFGFKIQQCISTTKPTVTEAGSLQCPEGGSNVYNTLNGGDGHEGAPDAINAKLETGNTPVDGTQTKESPTSQDPNNGNKKIETVDTTDMAEGTYICQTAQFWHWNSTKDLYATAIDYACAIVGEPADEDGCLDTAGGIGGLARSISECIEVQLPVVQFPSISSDTTDYTILVESKNVTKGTDFKTLGFEYDRIKHTDVGISLPILPPHTDASNNNVNWGCTALGITAAKAKKYQEVYDATYIPNVDIALDLTSKATAATAATIAAAAFNPTPQECNAALSIGGTYWQAGHYILETALPREKNYAAEAKGSYPAKLGSAADTTDIKYGVTYAKPTDLVQFRNTVRKNWYDVKDNLNKFAPSRENNASEVCDSVIESYYGGGIVGGPTAPKDSSTELRYAADVSLGNGFQAGKLNCKVGADVGGTTLDKEFTILRPMGGAEYPVRAKNEVKIGARAAQNDVGKKFVNEIAGAKPTWAYPTAYTCLNPNANSARSATDGITASFKKGNNVKCNQFGTSAVKEGGTGWSAAQVNVPYNYGTRPIISANPPHTTSCSYPKSTGEDADSGCTGTDVPATKQGWPNYGLVYAGEDFSFDSSVIINPRNNPDVFDDPYATYTKKTKYQIISFATTAESNKPSGYGTGPATQLPCAYYSGYAPPAGRGCIVLSEKNDQLYNKNGELLESHTDFIDKTNVIIDDLPVGSKICFAVAVFPADSHDLPDQDIPAGHGKNDDNSPSMKETGTQWAYGAPYCVTVAKKPNFQVWNSGMFTAAGVNTSQSPKLIQGSSPVLAKGSNITAVSLENKLLQEDPRNGGRTIFGSWAEWEVVSLSNVQGFGSGAAFGYSAPTGRTVGYGGGLEGFSADSANNPLKTLCATSKMTLGNQNCGGGLVTQGSAGNVDVLRETIDYATLNQITRRYAGSGTIGTGPSNDARRTYNIDYWSHLTDETAESIVGASGPDIVVPKGRVYVFDLRGQADATIRRNIRYEDNPSDKYVAISELPQAIILADNLTVASNVMNIEAWLLIGTQGRQADDMGIIGESESEFEHGTLRTCDTTAKNADECTNPLTVNGPIYARYIRLERTYGAFPGKDTCQNNYAGDTPSPVDNAYCTTDAHPNGWKGSVAPAERFILRIDTLWWAYSQSSEVPTPTSVHTHEPSVNF
jgi:hypothetical protein